MISGCIASCTVNLSHIARQVAGPAQIASRKRRLQRFFQYARLGDGALARTIVAAGAGAASVETKTRGLNVEDTRSGSRTSSACSAPSSRSPSPAPNAPLAKCKAASASTVPRIAIGENPPSASVSTRCGPGSKRRHTNSTTSATSSEMLSKAKERVV
ncbi:hypothetical protein [Sinorhizobium fredii]|uniref:Uncharacterized protein n=1 Tax=Rhizobium fredii TaxID=380 RepID=A0A844ARL4_RHIFR|nr:hypothetical protein [Sinorhizobium fredii]MQX13178.1 hypothetical protein [Sinorhizobium fredii]